eukprot:gene1011-1985_t
MAPKKNPKAVAEEKQAELQAQRDAAAAIEREREESATWSVGADSRGSSRAKALEDKAVAKAQLKAEKDALLAEEEASISTSGKKPTKLKKKGKDDFDLLNAALAEIPKTKAQKEAEQKKKLDEERKKKEAEDAAKREEKKAADELVRKNAAARGIVLDHGDEMMMIENTNRREIEYEEASGLDAAIDLLSVKDDNDQHPEKRQKALYNAYYERMLPIMKVDYPGLKLSQYKERIFDSWKSSPENPANR